MVFACRLVESGVVWLLELFILNLELELELAGDMMRAYGCALGWLTQVFGSVYIYILCDFK